MASIPVYFDRTGKFDIKGFSHLFTTVVVQPGTDVCAVVSPCSDLYVSLLSVHE